MSKCLINTWKFLVNTKITWCQIASLSNSISLRLASTRRACNKCQVWKGYKTSLTSWQDFGRPFVASQRLEIEIENVPRDADSRTPAGSQSVSPDQRQKCLDICLMKSETRSSRPEPPPNSEAPTLLWSSTASYRPANIKSLALVTLNPWPANESTSQEAKVPYCPAFAGQLIKLSIFKCVCWLSLGPVTISPLPDHRNTEPQKSEIRGRLRTSSLTCLISCCVALLRAIKKCMALI